MIVVIRIAHALIALPLYGAIGVIWYSAISHAVNVWLYLATGALALWVIVVAMNRGYCPLIYLSRRYGDEKRFFELFMPWRFAKYLFVFFFIVVIAGYVLILFDFG